MSNLEGQAPLYPYLSDQIDALDDYYGERFQTYQRAELREMIFGCFQDEKELHERVLDSALSLGMITLHEAMDLQLKLSNIQLSYSLYTAKQRLN